jgi:hypothetical protein
MYTLVKSLSFRQSLLRQAPALGASIGVAEAVYKFHSFTLECLAFLATWWVIDAAMELVHPGQAMSSLGAVDAER